jgi:hypothetical protein
MMQGLSLVGAEHPYLQPPSAAPVVADIQHRALPGLGDGANGIAVSVLHVLVVNAVLAGTVGDLNGLMLPAETT